MATLGDTEVGVARGSYVESEVSLQGLLTAVDWFEDGTTRRVALLTLDEREFEVEPYEVCRRLAPHAREQALLRGRIDDSGERPAVRVSSFVILDDHGILVPMEKRVRRSPLRP